jgi:hypothetical protein
MLEIIETVFYNTSRLLNIKVWHKIKLKLVIQIIKDWLLLNSNQNKCVWLQLCGSPV